MKRTLRVGSRRSPLALKQVEEVKRLFPGVEFEIITYQTQGDKDKITPLSDVGGSDFFTGEIDAALLRGEIELAVHSSKDLPDNLAQGLAVVYETKSLNPYDALVSKDNRKLGGLTQGSRIGVSSLRRKRQIESLRPDLELVDIRGNIAERLSLLDSGKVDALIVAYAALLRLGLEKRAAEILTQQDFAAHPKQGRLALVAKEENWQKVRSILSAQALETGS